MTRLLFLSRHSIAYRETLVASVNFYNAAARRNVTYFAITFARDSPYRAKLAIACQTDCPCLLRIYFDANTRRLHP